jgi:hypothetical protein
MDQVARVAAGVPQLIERLHQRIDPVIESPVGKHYVAQFDGVVVARTEWVHYPPWTRNLVTRYVIRDADGAEHVYHADPAEGLIDGFPIGSHLRKQRWGFNYELDGRLRNDFPFPFYLLWMILDFGLIVSCVIVVMMINARDRRARELEAAVERGRRQLQQDWLER